jgi:serine/threonine protein kinase
MILLDRYELLKAHGDHFISVGFGSYGQVKLAVDKKTGKNVAIKIVNILLNKVNKLAKN